MSEALSDLDFRGRWLLDWEYIALFARQELADRDLKLKHFETHPDSTHTRPMQGNLYFSRDTSFTALLLSSDKHLYKWKVTDRFLRNECEIVVLSAVRKGKPSKRRVSFQMYVVRSHFDQVTQLCHIRKLSSPPSLQENVAPSKSSIRLLLDAVASVENEPVRKSAAKLLDFSSEPDYVSLFYCQSDNKFPAFKGRPPYSFI